MSFTKNPAIKVAGGEQWCVTGWEKIGFEINQKLKLVNRDHKILVIECYEGVDRAMLMDFINTELQPNKLIIAEDAMLSSKEIIEKTFPDVTDDRIFGYMSRLSLLDFYDQDKLNAAKQEIGEISYGLTVIMGAGASLLAPKNDVLVYADMARWEIQLRMRANKVGNLGIDNLDDKFETKYKRAYFLDWRALDRLKKQLMHKWDFVLDTNNAIEPKLATGDGVRTGLKQATKQPFSVVPFFDPGPWGGQWMKEVCDLDKTKENFAWCFNCVPEENSLILQFGETFFELPSINLVFFQAKELLGDAVYGRFGDEFPIRFDFLDTMDGGNLSLQVHPLTEYIQEKFGMPYTQDESYYMLDAKPGAKVYLGLKEGINPDEMIHDLEESQNKGTSFDADKYAETFEAKKHDHFLIPAGTVHCSGKDSMVLEISSTPYIFTFKLYDWGRVGMDGKPRPINVEHGKNVIQWDRTTKWTKENLVNVFEPIAKGDGWREEKTGLHELEFIETRRHWFTKKVEHNTHNGVNVISLVEGEQVIVESPNNSFEPYIVNYAEVFVVPAGIGSYTIRPYGKSEGKEVGTLKAFVRTNP